ncbi:MAG: MaoC family dehydratase [Firmicutes bacterium]|nr:MaoC family dehydratase [Bacillota bacterium]
MHWSQGMALPALTHIIRPQDMQTYAQASGDFNPIHLQEDVAQAYGFPGVIVQGMLTMAWMARIVEPLQEQGTFFWENWHARFRSPLHAGDTVLITGKITAYAADYIDVDIQAAPPGSSRPAVTGQGRIKPIAGAFFPDAK